MHVWYYNVISVLPVRIKKSYLYDILLVLISAIWPNAHSLRVISLQNLSDLDFDL